PGRPPGSASPADLPTWGGLPMLSGTPPPTVPPRQRHRHGGGHHAAVSGRTQLPRGAGHPHRRGRGQDLPGRRRRQRRRGGPLGPLVGAPRQAHHHLRLRRPQPRGHPPGRRGQPAPRRPHHRGPGPGPVLLPLSQGGTMRRIMIVALSAALLTTTAWVVHGAAGSTDMVGATPAAAANPGPPTEERALERGIRTAKVASLASQLATARLATAKFATSLHAAKADGYQIITRMIPDMGWHFLNPTTQ